MLFEVVVWAPCQGHDLLSRCSICVTTGLPGTQDELLKYTRLDFLKLRSYEEVHALVEAGYAFGARRDKAGMLESHFGSLRRAAPVATPAASPPH
jgi:hypothetical protein